MSEVPYTDIGERILEGADWDDFRVLVEIVRAGSFNRAAERLKMTQPTVSRRLSRLEQTIGVRLFDRDRRGPRLTLEGQRIYNDACAAQASFARAASLTSVAGRRVEGICRIVMGDGVAIFWIPQFLPRFFTHHPNVELKLVAGSASVGEDAETADLKLHYFDPPDTSTVALRLGTMHFVPVASAGYLREYGTPKEPEELSKHRLLDLSHYQSTVGTWANWIPGAKTASVVQTHLSAVLGEAVRHGTGIALLPSYVSLIDPNYVALDVGIHFQAPIVVSYQRDAVKKWPVRLTLDYLRNCIFDRRHMPWFQDNLIWPSPSWKDDLGRLMKRAAEPLTETYWPES